MNEPKPRVERHRQAPLWQPEAFAGWLRRWKDAENFGWSDLADKAGISLSAVMGMAHPAGPKPGKKGRQSGYEPALSNVYRLARALDLDMNYVLEKAGLPMTGTRWSPFTTAERMALLALFNTAPELPESTQVLVRRLANELTESMPSQKEQE